MSVETCRCCGLMHMHLHSRRHAARWQVMPRHARLLPDEHRFPVPGYPAKIPFVIAVVFCIP